MSILHQQKGNKSDFFFALKKSEKKRKKRHEIEIKWKKKTRGSINELGDDEEYNKVMAILKYTYSEI